MILAPSLHLVALLALAGEQTTAMPWVSVSSHANGQGILLRRGSQCIVLTAGHVIKANAAADVMLGDGRSVKFAVERVDETADFAVLASDKLDPVFCPWPASDASIEAYLLSNPYGQIPVVSGPNQSEYVVVSRVRGVGDKLVLQSPQPDPRVEPGLSGAAVVFGGAVSGMVQKVSVQPDGTSQIVALRIEDLTRLTGVAVRSTSAEPAQRPPYDVSWMAPEFQAVVNAAQAEATQGVNYAAQARSLADQAEKLADTAIDTSSFANLSLIPLGQPVSFLNKEMNRRYAGQVTVKTSILGASTITSEGLGRSITVNDAAINDTYAGLYRDGQVLGVHKYASNPSNPNKLLRYEGQFASGKSGYGVLYWVDGRKYVGQFARDNVNGYGAFYPAGENGNRTDAFRVDGVPKGFAVTWSPEGKFLIASFWEKGKWVRDITDPRAKK